MDEAVAALVALNVVVSMILLMGLITEEEARTGAVRLAAQEAAAVAASHLEPTAGAARQRESQFQAAAAAQRVLFGICRRVDVEMIPPALSGPWRVEQVAVVVTCEPGARDERSSQGLAWVGAG